MTILFPSNYVLNNLVDETFQKEYYAALSNDIEIILFNQYLWDTEQKIELSHPIHGEVIYRGWMMKPQDYHNFYYQLKQNNIDLLTNPEQYKTLHCFPNIYPYIKDNTPKIMTFPLHAQLDVENIKKELGAFMIKDYVKSVKNTAFPQYFDNNVNQKDFDAWMQYFYKSRGNLLTEGIVAKEYVNLKKYPGNSNNVMVTNEYRAFYFHGQLISISRNSLQPEYCDKVPEELINQYTNLPSPFYTIDFGQLQNGDWTIIETGDGGVSGLSKGQNYHVFYRTLKVMNEKIQNIVLDKDTREI